VSAPDTSTGSATGAGITCAAVAADVIELAARRERTQVLKALAGRRGLPLPALGWIAAARTTLVLGVRPERWLLLSAPALPGVALANWRAPCAGCAAAIELSSALTALHLAGPAVPEVLARGCRLDLHPAAFVTGSAAATSMAQVPVLLAALPVGWLLLTPSSTARHLRDWLAATAAPFGFVSVASVTVASLSGESTQ
jgi:heterotetrameric sarcosine oxidase gamma subunit